MIPLDDYIAGEKFVDVADFVYAPNHGCDFNKLQHTFNLNRLYNHAIIYTHTMYVKELFDVIKNDNHKLIIISHNSDTNVKGFDIPDNVEKWYTTNVNQCDERIIAIPIGLENKRWLTKVDKIKIMGEVLLQEKKIRNDVYLNHNIKTNPMERQEPYDLFSEKEWVTAQRGENGQSFGQYIDNLYNHKFMICPEGNGIDTHRFWECLYMNTIPIYKKNIHHNFEGVLACEIQDWSDLESHVIKYKNVNIQSLYHFEPEKLTMEYWKDLILQR